jgi:hypothetical protein
VVSAIRGGPPAIWPQGSQPWDLAAPAVFGSRVGCRLWACRVCLGIPELGPGWVAPSLPSSGGDVPAGVLGRAYCRPGELGVTSMAGELWSFVCSPRDRGPGCSGPRWCPAFRRPR